MKQIHGVYDKLGSHGIEQHWWGCSMVMQYHADSSRLAETLSLEICYYNKPRYLIVVVLSLGDYLTIPFKRNQRREVNNDDAPKAFQTLMKRNFI